jgi:Bacterial type II and III secretion system protein
MLKWGISVALVLFLSASAMAQTQPPGATNAQDEVISIQVDPARYLSTRPVAATKAPKVTKIAAGETNATIPAAVARAAAEPLTNDGVLRIFRSGSKQEINRYVSQVIELKHAEALELLPVVQDAINEEEGTARALQYEPPDGGKARNFIQVITTREQMPSVVDTIKKLDLRGVTSGTGDADFSIRMKYRKASEVAAVLEETVLSDAGGVFADDATNTLYLSDKVGSIECDRAQIDFYDVPIPSVEFDVKVVAIYERNSDKLGIDWNAWKRSLGGQVDVTGNHFEGGKTFGRVDWLLTLDGSALADFLNYTVQQGNADILLRAKVTGNNEQPALVSTVQRVPYIGYTRTDQTAAILEETNAKVDAAGKSSKRDLNDPRTVQITPASYFTRGDLGTESEGLTVSIQPVIGTEMVTATVSIVANTVTGADKDDRPIVTTHTVNTTISLTSGAPVRIGNIEREVTNKIRRGIPGLKSIPILKYLFSVESTETEKSTLYVLATPVIRSPYAAKDIGDVKKQADILDLSKCGGSIPKKYLDR